MTTTKLGWRREDKVKALSSRRECSQAGYHGSDVLQLGGRLHGQAGDDVHSDKIDEKKVTSRSSVGVSHSLTCTESLPRSHGKSLRCKVCHREFAFGSRTKILPYREDRRGNRILRLPTS